MFDYYLYSNAFNRELLNNLNKFLVRNYFINLWKTHGVNEEEDQVEKVRKKIEKIQRTLFAKHFSI